MMDIARAAPWPVRALLSIAALALPAPGADLLTRTGAMRFLEQSTWGPTPGLVAHVQTVGKSAFLAEQFNAPPSAYPPDDPDSTSLAPLRSRFFWNALNGEDQLRQRVAFALSQILVVSGVSVGRDEQMIPYQSMLLRHAFSNYREILYQVTLSPTMGRFLDMVNNDGTLTKPPNENYARELLQLFTIGVHRLNSDGTPVSGADGKPVASYSEADVLELARALTGWTYPTAPGASPRWRNPPRYDGPMEPFENRHDRGEKVLPDGFILPAGQSARQDLEAALDHVFGHPNVPPFVAIRLIRSLVTSNPSPRYVRRVAGVFEDNGQGVRGDMRAVIGAILMDPEADRDLPDGGHLREPVLFAAALLRALGAQVDPNANPLPFRASEMGQDLFRAPSVFNYFSPLYVIPGSDPPLAGPEFQILTQSLAVARANFVYRAVQNGLGTGATVDLSPLVAISQASASDPGPLVDAVAGLLLPETLPGAERQVIVNALKATGNHTLRARNAVYLVATSSRYQVQH